MGVAVVCGFCTIASTILSVMCTVRHSYSMSGLFQDLSYNDLFIGATLFHLYSNRNEGSKFHNIYSNERSILEF